jgi:hypothetical protein
MIFYSDASAGWAYILFAFDSVLVPALTHEFSVRHDSRAPLLCPSISLRDVCYVYPALKFLLILCARCIPPYQTLFCCPICLYYSSLTNVDLILGLLPRAIWVKDETRGNTPCLLISHARKER